MNLKELNQQCSEFQNGSNNFSQIVKDAVELIPSLPVTFALKFDVNQFTVNRWAKGLTKPLPRFQKLVIETIQEKAQSI